MFVDKWSRCFRVTFGTNRVLIRSRFQLLVLKSTVRVMAVAASHQPFINLVVEGLGERRLHVGVAAIAKRRLRHLQQADFRLEAVNAMATGATQASFAVRRTLEVGVRARVATQAGCIDLLR